MARAVEKAGALYSLTLEQLAGTILPLLGLGTSKKQLGELELLRKLEDPVARFCADNAVALREAALWADFPREGQRALLVLVRAVPCPRAGLSSRRSFSRAIRSVFHSKPVPRPSCGRKRWPWPRRPKAQRPARCSRPSALRP